MRRILVPTALAALCSTLAAIAHAADKPKPAAPATTASAQASAAPTAPPGPETADSLYNQGNDAYDKGDFPLALELYTGAFKLRKSYDIARNLGLTELKLGKLRAAIEHLSYSLEHYPSNRADTKRQVIDWLDQAKADAGKLEISVAPEGAACSVNGIAIALEDGKSKVFVDPGALKIECGAEGFGKSKRSLAIEKGATETIAIALPRAGTIDEPPPPPPPSGYSALPLSTRRTILWTGVGLTGLALVGGVVSGAISITTAGEADATLADLRKSSGRENPCASPAVARCDELRDARATQDLTGNVALWTLVGAAGAGAFTAAYLLPRADLLGGSRAHERPGDPGGSRPSASVTIAPGVGGMVISGSW